MAKVALRIQVSNYAAGGYKEDQLESKDAQGYLVAAYFVDRLFSLAVHYRLNPFMFYKRNSLPIRRIKWTSAFVFGILKLKMLCTCTAFRYRPYDESHGVKGVGMPGLGSI